MLLKYYATWILKTFFSQMWMNYRDIFSDSTGSQVTRPYKQARKVNQFSYLCFLKLAFAINGRTFPFMHAYAFQTNQRERNSKLLLELSLKKCHLDKRRYHPHACHCTPILLHSTYFISLSIAILKLALVTSYST